MTVTSSTRSVTHNGDGSTTAFPVPFYFIDADDLIVTLIDADGDDNVLSDGYSVSGAGNPVGGTVTLITAPASGEKLRIERVLEILQETQYPENTKFPASSHERAIDRLTMIDQQQQGEINRAPKFTETSGVTDILLPAPQDGRGWKYDAASGRYVNTDFDPDQAQGDATAAAAAAAASASAAATSEGNASDSADLSQAWATGTDPDGLGSLSAREEADRAEDAKEAAEAVATEIASLPQWSFADTAALAGSAPAADPEFVWIDGHYYTKSASEPAHAAKAQNGNGTWYALAEKVVMPTLFGATAGTATDQASAFQDAFDFCRTTGAELIVPEGNWRIDTAVASDAGFRIRLHPRAVIDLSGAPNGTHAFQFVGDYGTAYEVGSTSTGAGTVTTSTAANAGNFTFGDYVIIRSDNVYDASDTSSKIGEINRVLDADAGTGVITLQWGVRNAYSTSPVIEKPAWVEGLHISGGWIRGETGLDNLDSAKRGLLIQAAIDPIVEGMRFTRCDHRGIGFVDCTGAIASKNKFEGARSSTTAYGVSFVDATQDSQAVGNSFNDVRHSLSTNNTTARGGIPRRILFANNHVTRGAPATGGSGGDAIDTHAAAEDIDIINNTLIGSTGAGINFECRSGKIIGNTVRNTTSHGINVHNESDFSGDIIVSKNRIFGAGSDGIRVQNGVRGTSAIYEGAVVSGNIVRSTTGVGVNVGGSAGDYMRRSTVSGNTVSSPGSHGILATRQRDLSMTGNASAGNGTQNAIRCTDCIGPVVTGNNGTQPNGSTAPVLQFSATASGDTTGGVVSGNRFGPDAGSITGNGVTLVNNVTHTLVRGNNVRGTGGVSIGSGTGNSTSVDNLT